MNSSFLFKIDSIKTHSIGKQCRPSLPRSQLMCSHFASFTTFGSMRQPISRVRAGSTLATEPDDNFYKTDDNQIFQGNSMVTNAPALDMKVGVLLLNLGGPETLEDVQPFLYNLFADPDIIRLPTPVQFLQPVIAQLVSIARAPKSREGYEAIGGGSPLRRITEDQASALKNSLYQKGLAAETYVAMRYWKPFTGRFCKHNKHLLWESV